MRESNNRWMLKTAPVWSIPFLIPTATAIGLLLGMWLDGKLDTKPWLAIILGLVGLVAGIVEFIRILIEVNREDGD